MHALPEADWAAAERAAEYAPASLDEQGYIPFSHPDAIVSETNERFAASKRDDIALLAVNGKHLQPALRYEVGETGSKVPRLYESLAPADVIEFGHFPRDGDGFHLPEWAVSLTESSG